MRITWWHRKKPTPPKGAYAPKFFSPQITRLFLAMPVHYSSRQECGGAMEAGAPEFIDLLTSENPKFQLKIGGGLMWLNELPRPLRPVVYGLRSPEQQKEILPT